MNTRAAVSALFCLSVTLVSGCSSENKEESVKAEVAAPAPSTPLKYSLEPDPLSDSELRDYQHCQLDDDCIPVANGCHECKDASIAKDKLFVFRKNFDCSKVNLSKEPSCTPKKIECELYRCKSS